MQIGGPTDYRTVHRKNRRNIARACQDYGLGPTQTAVVTDDLVAKFIERRTPDGVSRCYIHGGPVDATWHLEHVHPLVLGGHHRIHNLEVACPSCNLMKGGKTLEQVFGPVDAAQIRAGLAASQPGRFPLSVRDHSTEALWAIDKDSDKPGDLARRWARAPRMFSAEVPTGRPIVQERHTQKIARLLVTAAPSETDRYIAATVEELVAISKECGESTSAGSLTRTWLKLMGLGRKHSGGDQFGFRAAPSLWIQPVSLSDTERPYKPLQKGFRIRFSVDARRISTNPNGPFYLPAEPEPASVLPDELDAPPEQAVPHWTVTGDTQQFPDIDGYQLIDPLPTSTTPTP